MTDSLGTQVGKKLIAIVEKAKNDLSSTYATQEYVDSIISSGIITRIVDELPERGDSGILYLVPVSNSSNNKYKEYAFINGAWEDIGSTEFNLEDYPNRTAIETALAGKLAKNDPSIPTKLSDLEVDEASKFIKFEVVNSLPSLANAKTNIIYLVEHVIHEDYSTNSDLVLTTSDLEGTKLYITNKLNVVVYVYQTLIGGTEGSSPVLTLQQKGTGNLTIPVNTAQLRFDSLNDTVSIGIDYKRDNANNFIKYIKVVNNGTPSWEILGNPDSASYDYVHNNYYAKGQIYTETEVQDAIDDVITMLNNAGNV